MRKFRSLKLSGCWLAIMVALVVSGCAGTRVDQTPQPSSELEAEAVEDVLQQLEASSLDEVIEQGAGTYQLQTTDEIEIQVFREPEFSGVFRINPSGEIRHSLLGAVALGGLTVDEAEARLTAMLGASYLVNPRVILKVLTAQSSQIVIFGEVKKPGIYPFPVGESITLLQAIASAGGFTDLASPDRVRIVRKVDGESTTIRARVADMLGGRGKQKDIPLEPNDVIVVPQIIF